MNPRLPLLALLAVSLASGCLSVRKGAPEADADAAAPAEAGATAVTNAAPAEVVTPVVLPTNGLARITVDEPTRLAAVRYMDAIGIDRSMTNLVRDVVGGYRANLPRVPDAFWEDFARGVTTEWLGDRFVQEIAVLYTLEELVAVCEFFESPLGRKFIESERTLQQRNSQHITAFTRVLSRELENRLRARKFIF